MSRSFKISIDSERCKGCEYCFSVCPNQVFCVSDEYNSSGYHYMIIKNADACTGCQFCTIICPDIAIELL